MNVHFDHTGAEYKNEILRGNIKMKIRGIYAHHFSIFQNKKLVFMICSVINDDGINDFVNYLLKNYGGAYLLFDDSLLGFMLHYRYGDTRKINTLRAFNNKTICNQLLSLVTSKFVEYLRYNQMFDELKVIEKEIRHYADVYTWDNPELRKAFSELKKIVEL